MDASSVTLEIGLLSTDNAWRWDRFARHAQDATFFHLAGWKEVIERAFGHQTYFLFAESSGEICGILPLALVRSRIFGSGLISTPFCVYGGSIGTTREICDRLDAEATRLAGELGVDYLELRNRAPRHLNWPSKDLYVTFRKSIVADSDENLRAIPRKQRAMVRKGIQAGLVSRVEARTDAVYRVYSESLRNLGTPVFSARYFRVLKDVFGDDCEALTVYRDKDLVAGVLSFYFRDEVLPYYGGGTAAARALKANDFMYWELMRRAAERGIGIFDFGRSKRGTGSFDFKRNWGFTPEPMSYEYHLVRAHAVPEVNPLNPKYRLFINAWQRLPLPISRLLGPSIAKKLG